MTTLSPSPRELVARLSDDEKVVIDLLLQDAAEDDACFATLVPDPKRRGYLKTLTIQLRALGVTVHEAGALDQQCAGWQAARRGYEERTEALRQQRAARAEEDHLRTQAQPPEVQKAVARNRRRKQRQRR